MVVPVALLSYGGNWLDRTLDTPPWFLLGGMLLGMAVGFYTLFRRAVPRNRGRNGKSK